MSRELVAAALEGAVTVLAEQGWRQGPRTVVRDLHLDPIDMGGAVLLAALAGNDLVPTATYYEAVSCLAEWIGDADTGPAGWRDVESLAVDVDAWADVPGRTLREVVHALYGAARLTYPTRDREAA